MEEITSHLSKLRKRVQDNFGPEISSEFEAAFQRGEINSENCRAVLSKLVAARNRGSALNAVLSAVEEPFTSFQDD